MNSINPSKLTQAERRPKTLNELLCPNDLSRIHEQELSKRGNEMILTVFIKMLANTWDERPKAWRLALVMAADSERNSLDWCRFVAAGGWYQVPEKLKMPMAEAVVRNIRMSRFDQRELSRAADQIINKNLCEAENQWRENGIGDDPYSLRA